MLFNKLKCIRCKNSFSKFDHYIVPDHCYSCVMHTDEKCTNKMPERCFCGFKTSDLEKNKRKVYTFGKSDHPVVHLSDDMLSSIEKGTCALKGCSMKTKTSLICVRCQKLLVQFVDENEKAQSKYVQSIRMREIACAEKEKFLEAQEKDLKKEMKELAIERKRRERIENRNEDQRKALHYQGSWTYNQEQEKKREYSLSTSNPIKRERSRSERLPDVRKMRKDSKKSTK